MDKTKIGIIGCGNISGIYLKNCTAFRNLEVVACADMVREKAEAKAREFNIPRVSTVDEILADPEIRIIVNLTIPKAHASVALAAVTAGKSVYNEKPLTLSREEGKELLKLAKRNRVRVGCAPDTFMGAGIQTCRKLIDDGVIGTPIGATAFMLCHGHETWHPAPEFYYQPGGGPMFDMGPYYLTALVNLLGPVSHATGAAQISYPERLITSQPKAGTKITVEIPTHIAGIMEFTAGAVGTIVTSFDIYAADHPLIEVYGTEGTIRVPDPNTFGGVVKVWSTADRQWKEVPLTHGYAENSRGIGVADTASALRNRRPHRANGQLAYHVLDLMHAFHDAARTRKTIKLKSKCDRPAPMPAHLDPYTID
ncbi:Gfo/Idh/MocA family oxidoreductase [bacterium]|nr:Gfo/Idh/MocA family oxidoreductase [bacterium]